MYKAAISFLVFFVASPVDAQPARDYRCTVERVESSGVTESKGLQAQRKAYLGREFSVDRRTGVMAGALKNSYITRPEVIDAGSAENSFKVVTTLRREQGIGSGSNVHILVVREYKAGAKKPFVFLDNDDVYFGTCVHF